MINLAVFSAALLALGAGVWLAFGLAWALMVTGGVLAVATFVISLIPERGGKNEST